MLFFNLYLDDGLSSQHIGHRALTAQKMSFKLRLTNTNRSRCAWLI